MANVTNALSFRLSFSDHDMIGCVRKINTIKYDPRTIECLDYKHYNHSDLCNDIKNINWKPIKEASDFNKALKYFNTKVSKVFDRYAPTMRKKVKERLCKWLIRELKKETNFKTGNSGKPEHRVWRTTALATNDFEFVVTL